MADGIRLATYAELVELTARVEALEDTVTALDPSGGTTSALSSRVEALEESVAALAESVTAVEDAVTEYGLSISTEEATTANWGQVEE